MKEHKNFSFWPYIIIGMLSCTGIVNYLLVFYSNSVYSKPVSMSPYNDSLKFDQKAAELRCANDKNFIFRLNAKRDIQEIQIIGNLPPGEIINLSGWSGAEEVVQEELTVDGHTKTAKITSKLSPGLWNFEISGKGSEGICNWRAVLRDTIYN